MLLIVLNTLLPLVGPLFFLQRFERVNDLAKAMKALDRKKSLVDPIAPLDSYRSLQPTKNMNYDLFSQFRY